MQAGIDCIRSRLADDLQEAGVVLAPAQRAGVARERGCSRRTARRGSRRSSGARREPWSAAAGYSAAAVVVAADAAVAEAAAVARPRAGVAIRSPERTGRRGSARASLARVCAGSRRRGELAAATSTAPAPSTSRTPSSSSRRSITGKLLSCRGGDDTHGGRTAWPSDSPCEQLRRDATTRRQRVHGETSEVWVKSRDEGPNRSCSGHLRRGRRTATASRYRTWSRKARRRVPSLVDRLPHFTFGCRPGRSCSPSPLPGCCCCPRAGRQGPAHPPGDRDPDHRCRPAVAQPAELARQRRDPLHLEPRSAEAVERRARRRRGRARTFDARPHAPRHPRGTTSSRLPRGSTPHLGRNRWFTM